MERRVIRHGDGKSLPNTNRAFSLFLDRIFIIEGCITIGISFISYFFIVPFPEQCTFFAPEEKALLLARLKDDGGAVAHDKLSPKRIYEFFQDWKIWIAVIIYVGALENANSITSFQPTILVRR